MDTADVVPGAIPAEPPVGDPPSIGVPSIPAQGGQARPPVPVPSLPVPPGSAVAHLAPVAPATFGTEPRFSPGVAAQLRSYVYVLVDPRTGRAFCVGRGRNDRCFRHLAAARGGPAAGSAPTGRPPKFAMLDRIREIESDGRAVRVDILRYGMSPEEARTVEAAVHDALGLTGKLAGGSQRQPAVELNSSLAKPAKFKRAHQVVLLRVGGTGSDPSYEAVRHGWRIGRRWTDPDSPRSPQWAVIVTGDLVAAVYRIGEWEADPAPADPGRPGRTVAALSDRHSFSGWRDAELEGRYVGRSVAGYLGGITQSPVSYVWCGPHWVNTAG